MRVALYVALNSTSKAPLSQATPFGRVVPRWSAAVQPADVPALIAALPASSACVWVDPPFRVEGSQARVGVLLVGAEREPALGTRLDVSALRDEVRSIRLAVARGVGRENRVHDGDLP